MTAPLIAILGAGSWGTAMAIHLAQHTSVCLWARNLSHVEAMQKECRNTRYLPDIPFPPHLTITDNLLTCVTNASHVIVAVPSHAFEDILKQLPKPQNGLAWLTKGLAHNQTYLSHSVQQKWGADFPVAIITGPSFAKEVASGLPTALIIAGNNTTWIDSLHTYIHHHPIRVYKSCDILGAQWCGAVKNVLAIACGISDGLGFGANAKAALITRGIHEMTRLGVVLGGKSETFSGLAGLGDLVLTCTDNQSRNRRFGLLIGEGSSISAAEKTITQVIEGKSNAEQVVKIANAHHIEMPICEAVHQILIGKISPLDAQKKLLDRPL